MKNRWFVVLPTLTAVFISAAALASTEDPALLKDRQRMAAALKDNKPKLAAEILEPWLSKFPQDFELINDYALALAQMGELDRARGVLEQALVSHPQAGLAFSNLREILSHQAAISYAQAMGKRPPGNQIALKGAVIPEPPVVVAQAAPRPDAQIALPVRPQSPEVADNGAIPSDLKALLAAAPPPELAPKVVASQQAVAPKSAQALSESASSEKVGQREGVQKDGLQRELEQATRRWAEDWSSRNFDAYLSHYSERFNPVRFPSRQAWVENRRPRVARSDSISVAVSDIRVVANGETGAEVRFRQRYESRTLKVSSVKRLVWEKEESGWKIISEEGR